MQAGERSCHVAGFPSAGLKAGSRASPRPRQAVPLAGYLACRDIRLRSNSVAGASTIGFVDRGYLHVLNRVVPEVVLPPPLLIRQHGSRRPHAIRRCLAATEVTSTPEIGALHALIGSRAYGAGTNLRLKSRRNGQPPVKMALDRGP